MSSEGRVCAVKSQPIPGTYTLTGYVYDAEGNRVAKGTITAMSCDPGVNGFQATNDYVRGPGGEQLTETGSDGQGNMVWAHTNVYADGRLMATYNPDGLHFHLTDLVGTRRVQTDYEGVVEQTCASLPYGDGETCGSGPTEQLYAGLEHDDETGLDHAVYRQYASAMGRWISPDPYNGSYDLEDPQSLNRYAYVEGNPLDATDPAGASMWSTFCSSVVGFWPDFSSNSGKVSAIISAAGYGLQVDKGNCVSALEKAAKFWGTREVAEYLANHIGSAGNQYTQKAFTAYIQAGISIACSIDFNSDACSPELAWLIPGANGDVGKAVGDALDVVYAVCAATAPSGAVGATACFAVGIYEVVNKIYQFFASVFGWGSGPQFKGSLQPRPGVPGQASVLSTLGVPINGENLYRQTGKSSSIVVPSPTYHFTRN